MLLKEIVNSHVSHIQRPLKINSNENPNSLLTEGSELNKTNPVNSVINKDLINRIENIENRLNPLKVNFRGESIFERGETVNNLLLQWDINKEVESISINNGVGYLTPNTREKYLRNLDLSNDITFEIIVKTNKEEARDSFKLKFKDRIFWGVSRDKDLDISKLHNSLLAENKENVTFNFSGTDQYLYLALPHIWGNKTFYYSNLEFDYWEEFDTHYVNSFGVTRRYRVYKSIYRYNGSDINLIMS